jgi:hypothetical protein
MNNIVPFNDMQQMAEVAAGSKMFGFKNTQEAMAIMLLCQAENMHPAVAMRDFHVIQGRPALKADAMLARFQQAGGKVDWKEYTDAKVTGLFSHPQGGSLEVSWTLQQAKAIGIANKDNWKNYPRAMLRARVVSEGIRSVYPGCVVGVYTPEEVQDFTPPVHQSTVKDMGMAERVEDVLPTEVPSIQEASGAFKLYVPNSEEPHAAFTSKEDWIGAYAHMVFRIHNSTKILEADKPIKFTGLEEANEDMLGSLDSFQKLKLRTELVALGVPQGPKASKSLPSQEQEPNEGIY